MPNVQINGETVALSSIGCCPECGANWDDGPIYDKLREHPAYSDKTDAEVRAIAEQYGDPDGHFSRLVGVEVRGLYDGVLYWECPDCHKQWPRHGVK